MIRVFGERDRKDEFKPEPYSPAQGQTLEKIVATQPTCKAHHITWQELALYNWATAEPREVNRALIEMIGCPLDGVDWANPEKTKLDPAFGPAAGDKKLLVPIPWKKENLGLRKTHTLKVRQRKPMPAVRITKLSKWFIPETETCDIGYNLEGIKERADELVWEVRASQYATATPRPPAPPASDLQEFTFSPCDVPLRSEKMADRKDPRPGSDYALNEWDGESKAADGVLKPRAGKKRYITVANSPYTIQFRFHKTGKHEKAAIRLHPFWPRWKKPAPVSPPAIPPAPTEIDPESLKIRWKVENCATLKHGQLLIWDKADSPDAPVFRKALAAGDLGEGDHEFVWDKGKTLVRADGMPYRVQIQAHSGIDDDDGVALAVMHTEVRLYAPPELETHADPVADPQCFDFQLAPFVPDETVIALGSRKWYQLHLAKIGLHPGPANGQNHDHFRLALRDFQRSYTKNAAAPFERLRADGGENGDTQTALSRVSAAAAPASPPASPPGPGSADVARPMFGDRAQINNPGAENIAGEANINTRLKDSGQEMISWIDDRHYYTDSNFRAGAPASPPPPPAFPDPNMRMENYRSSMDLGDDRTTMDAQSTARPWIPVACGLPLLSKQDALERNSMPALTDAMRRAAGPLRVDWTFTEIGEDLTVIDVTRYGGARLRSRKYVDEITKNLQGTHQGKAATNCPQANGGIRPRAGSPPGDPPEDYYKMPFGLEEFSLAPWKARADTALKRVSTLAHDDLGQDAAKVYSPLVGKAGVYLNPSRIAGDGYQFRARVSFEKFGGAYLYPNHEVLNNRYAKLPQAHTCKLRNWRKTSFRTYVAWAPNAERRWTTWDPQVINDYHSGFVHFAYEPGARVQVPVLNLYPAAGDQTALLNLMENASDAQFQGIAPRVLSGDFLWPWTTHANLGVTYGVAANTAWSDFRDDILNRTYFLFADPLVIDLMYRVERQLGRLRGHVLVEFRGSPRCWTQVFECLACNGFFQSVQSAAGGGASPARCPGCNAAGPLSAREVATYTCPTCAAVRRFYYAVGTSPAVRVGACTHNMNRTAVTVTTFRGNSLISTAMGLILGCSVLIVLSNANDWPWWTHEIGHNRHMEHCAGEAGWQDAQHDCVNNTSDAALQADAGIDVLKKRWDRVCTMSYTESRNPGELGGDDRQQFCGKCLLKSRGWRVESLPDLSAGVLGPAVAGP